jgi:hypothetical protein
MAEAEPTKRRQSRAAGPAHAAGPIEAVAAPASLSPGVAALIQLATFDGVLDSRGPAPAAGTRRETLARQVPPEMLDAYDRALRAGRRPAVAALDGSVCRGCHMRLHSSLAQRIHSRGAAACPHCLRVVYEPGAERP